MEKTKHKIMKVKKNRGGKLCRVLRVVVVFVCAVLVCLGSYMCNVRAHTTIY
jgi:hypothetical protein